MAKADMTIRRETRPCLVSYLRWDDAFAERKPVYAKALWHTWVSSEELHTEDVPGCVRDGIYQQKALRQEIVYGLVEKEDGTVGYERATNIKFLDSEAVFAEYDWQKG